LNVIVLEPDISSNRVVAEDDLAIDHQVPRRHGNGRELAAKKVANRATSYRFGRGASKHWTAPNQPGVGAVVVVPI